MGRQVQGEVRRRLGQAARRDLRAPEEARRDSGRCPAHPATRGAAGVGCDACRHEADSRPPDGSVCGVHGAHRLPRRTPHRHARRSRDSRRHARLLHRRRQRRLRRRHAERQLQRDGVHERHGRPGDARVPDQEDRRVRRSDGLQPLCRGLGTRDGYAISVDQAGRVALGRHAQRRYRSLAEEHQGARATIVISSIT